MGPFRKRLERILRQRFPKPASIELREDDGVIGVIASPEFRGKEPMERVTMIWDILDKELSPEERKKIVTILAVTPEEEIAHSTSG
jgi:stress-induced morphogen